MLPALLKEIDLKQHFFPLKTEIETIYFGGGTPSLLSTLEINNLLSGIRKYFTINEKVEITLEANPDDLSVDYLTALKNETEINRLSIGVQSFFDNDLRYMSRAHNASEAKASIQKARTVGFTNISVDLIYGTPTMSNEQWKENLAIVFDLQIPHISCYSLTIEERTQLSNQIKKKKEKGPEEEQTIQQFFILLETMRKNNYTHYEISNFCKEPHFAIHNTNYWRGVPYLGIGPSAHSYDGKKRFWNISNNAMYTKKILQNELADESEILLPADQYNEYVMTSIRTIWGVSVVEIQTRFGEVYKKHFLSEISPFISNNRAMERNGIYILTDEGKLFCDLITENLFMSKKVIG